MNGINNNTPTVQIEGEVTPKALKAATIVARKSLMGKWKKTGAPPKEIIGLTKTPARGTFTKHDIFDRNGRTVSLLTIDKRIKALIKAKKLCRLAEALKTDAPGRPSYRYSFDLSKAAPKKVRKAKAMTAVVLPEAPVTAETPVQADVAAGAPVETATQA